MLHSSAGKLTCRREVNTENNSSVMSNKSPKSKKPAAKIAKPTTKPAVAAKKTASKKK